MSVTDRLALRSLTELRALKVTPLPRSAGQRLARPRYDLQWLHALALDDAPLAQLLGAIGRPLRELVLWLQAGCLTVGALWGVGTGCMLLERLELAVRYADAGRHDERAGRRAAADARVHGDGHRLHTGPGD